MLRSLLAPGVWMMRRLNLAPKFALVAFAFLVPILVSLVIVVKDRKEALAFTHQEVLGIKQIRDLSALIEPSARWRGNKIGAATGTSNAQSALEKATGDVDQALDRLSKALKQPGGDQLGLLPGLQKLVGD